MSVAIGQRSIASNEIGAKAVLGYVSAEGCERRPYLAIHFSQPVQMKTKSVLSGGCQKPLLRSQAIECWLTCFALVLSGCAPKTETVPGELHLKLEAISSADTTFVLSNDSKGIIQIRGERTLSRTVRAWPPDVEVACQTATALLESESASTTNPIPDDINVRPGERVRIAVHTTLPQSSKSQRCILSVVLKGGDVVGPLEFAPRHMQDAAIR
jgi:hypothetical protein